MSSIDTVNLEHSSSGSSCSPCSISDHQAVSTEAPPTMTSLFQSLIQGNHLHNLLALRQMDETCKRPTSSNSSVQDEDEKNTQSGRPMDYLERRRKNNDSARKSREVRRMREQATRDKMKELEAENVQLQAQMALLRLEYNQLVMILISQTGVNIQANSEQK